MLLQTAFVRRIACSVLFGLISFTTDASPLLVKPVFEGRAVSGASACAFRGSDSDEIFSPVLSSDEVICHPSDKPFSLAPGWWSLYVNGPSNLTSDHPYFVHIGKGSSKNPLVRTYPLVRAATIDFRGAKGLRRQGQHLAVYHAAQTGSPSLSGMRPVARLETSVTVPAGVAVVPLVVRGGIPIRLGRTVRAEPGESLPAIFDPQLGRDLILPISLPKGLSSELRARMEKEASSPDVRLVPKGGGKTIAVPEITLAPVPFFNRSLLIFRNLQPGEYDVILSGKLWATTRRTVRVHSDRDLTLDREPIVPQSASKIEVSWSVDPRFEEASFSSEECAVVSSSPSAEAVTELRLRQCPPGTWNGDEPPCRILESRSVTGEAGSEQFELPPVAATYAIEIRRGDVRHAEMIDVGEVTETSRHLALRATSLSGRVTRGGKPVKAHVAFRTGSAVSKEATGEYAALFGRVSQWSPVRIHACDGSWNYEHIPARDVTSGAVYDIEIPMNRVEVGVRDLRSGLPVAEARVTLHVNRAGPDADLEMHHRSLPPTRDDGSTSWENIPFDVPLSVCASSADHQYTCAEEFELASDETRAVAVSLLAKDLIRGDVPARRGQGGMIWLMDGGQTLDVAPIAVDGSFIIRRPVSGSNHFVIGGGSGPLHIAAVPPFGPETDHLSIVVSPFLLRTFSVINGAEPAWFTLEIGGHMVPTMALGPYLSGPHSLGSGARVTVANVAESGTIVALVYRSSLDPILRASGATDPFTDPRARAMLAARPLSGGQNTITLD